MEPKFNIIYKVNRDTYKELYKYTMFQRPIKIIWNIILLLAFLFDLFLTIFCDYVAGALFFVPLIYVFEVFLYYRNISLSIKRNNEMKHENEFTTYEFYEEHFVFISSSGGKVEVDLSDIRRFRKSKKFVFLLSKANLAYWFPIDSFEVGSFEEFKSYLCRKGIKVK